MTERDRIEEVIRASKALDRMYQNRIDDILKLDNPRIRRQNLKSFLALMISLIDQASKKGYNIPLISIHEHLTPLLGGKMGQYQFAQKDIDHQPEGYFEHFDQLNKTVRGLKETDLTNISAVVSDIENKLKEPIPMIKVDRLEASAKNKFRITQYFSDYLTQISDFYESFVLLGHYILILFRLLEGKDVKQDIPKIIKGNKISVGRLYTGKDSNKTHQKDLRDYIEQTVGLEEHRQVLLEMFDSIFAKEGIRELRNKRFHHFGEESLRLIDNEYIQVTYGSKKLKYSQADLYWEKINLQLLVSCGFFILNAATCSLTGQLMEHELSKKMNQEEE